MSRRLDAADSAYEQAVFGGDGRAVATALRGLDALGADLALARGRLIHAGWLVDRGHEHPDEMRLFQEALAAYVALGDERGAGEARLWTGIVHQVVRGDDKLAVPAFSSALTLSRGVGDAETQAYALRHLGIAAHRARDRDQARRLLEESTDLRRGLGHDAGVAANLIGLALVAKDQRRYDDMAAAFAEARELTAAPEAAGIRRMLDEVMAELRS